jgi:hypothetical protein
MSEKPCFGCNGLSRLETFEWPTMGFKPTSRRVVTGFEPIHTVEIHVRDYKDSKPSPSFYALQ